MSRSVYSQRITGTDQRRVAASEQLDRQRWYTTAQTSLDVDANRLVLLDRAEVGAAAQEEIPF